MGGAFAADKLKGTGSHDAALGAEQVTAAEPNGELRVGNAATTTCAVPLADGDGTLAFTKTGGSPVWGGQEKVNGLDVVSTDEFMIFR